MIYTQAMNTTEEKKSLSELQEAVFETYVIKEQIPGNIDCISKAFRKFLVKPSLCDMFYQNVNQDDTEVNITSLSYSPKRTHILSWSGENAIIWNASTGDLANTFQHRTTPSVSFSADGTVELTQENEIPEKRIDLSQNSSAQKFLEHTNLNQIELLQAFELAIRENSRIHIKNNIEGAQIRQTFATFPLSIQRKLRRFIVQQENHQAQPNGSSSSSQSTIYRVS